MRAALRRFLPLLGVLSALPLLRAQSAELPPIFAPHSATVPAATRSSSSPSTKPTARAGLSEHVRQTLTERVLADAKVFEAPPPSASTSANPAPVITDDGALLMNRFVVRSYGPTRREVEPAPVTLYRFEEVERVERRVKPGFTANLASFFDGKGLLQLSVVNGAGQGIDHGRDFVRVELGFSLKF